MTTTIDRRKFLTYTGAAGAATGAAWVAPSVLGSSTAFAAGSCQIRDQINWGAFNTGDYAWSSETLEVDLPVNRTAGQGAPGTAPYTVKMAVTPVGSVASRAAQVSNGEGFAVIPASYKLDMQGNASQTGDFGWDITFTWLPAYKAYNLNFTLGEIDDDGGNTSDRVYIEPLLNVPPDTYSFTPGFVAGFGTPSSPWYGAAGNQDDGTVVGNVGVSYALTTVLSTMTVHYRGDPSATGSVQSIAISNLSWCL